MIYEVSTEGNFPTYKIQLSLNALSSTKTRKKNIPPKFVGQWCL